MRDSIEEYIRRNYDGAMRKALFQYVKPTTELLFHADDPRAALETMREIDDGIECAYSIAAGESMKATSEIHAMILDSEARSRANINATAHADGHVFAGRPMSKLGDSCNW